MRRDADVEASPGAGVLATFMPCQEAVHEIRFGQVARRKKRITERQGHGRVIGPLARFQVEGTTTHHIGNSRLGIPSRELQGGSDRIPHSEPQQAASRPILDLIIRGARAGCRDRHGLPYGQKLFVRINGAGSFLTNTLDCRLGIPTQLDKKPRGHHAGAAEAAAAMQKDVASRAQ